jgi:hypothetical protein
MWVLLYDYTYICIYIYTYIIIPKCFSALILTIYISYYSQEKFKKKMSPGACSSRGREGTQRSLSSRQTSTKEVSPKMNIINNAFIREHNIIEIIKNNN